MTSGRGNNEVFSSTGCSRLCLFSLSQTTPFTFRSCKTVPPNIKPQESGPLRTVKREQDTSPCPLTQLGKGPLALFKNKEIKKPTHLVRGKGPDKTQKFLASTNAFAASHQVLQSTKWWGIERPLNTSQTTCQPAPPSGREGLIKWQPFSNILQGCFFTQQSTWETWFCIRCPCWSSWKFTRNKNRYTQDCEYSGLWNAPEIWGMRNDMV